MRHYKIPNTGITKYRKHKVLKIQNEGTEKFSKHMINKFFFIFKNQIMQNTVKQCTEWKKKKQNKKKEKIT